MAAYRVFDTVRFDDIMSVFYTRTGFAICAENSGHEIPVRPVAIRTRG